MPDDKPRSRDLFGHPERRAYETSHPWLTFRLDLSSEPLPRLWSLLGECQSKCEHIAGAPLRPATANELNKVYLAKGVLASAAIEGNTLTEEEAIEHVEGRLETPPSREYLKREIDNILQVHNEMAADLMAGRPRQFSSDLIKEYNRRLLHGLEVQSHVIPGEIPTQSIGVGRYRGAPREDCLHLLESLSGWLNKDWVKPGLFQQIPAAIVKAVMAHLYLVWIHPFGDGNGRTARLMEVQVLLQAGVPYPSCQLLSNHYNRTRERYYIELKRTSEPGGSPVSFLLYAIEGMRDGLKEQIALIRDQQWDVSWRNYVYELFKDAGKPDKRRRDLVLDLSRQSAPMPRSEIRSISPRVGDYYRDLDEKTLVRDLAALEDQGLIVKRSGGYVANRELILAFLPARVEDLQSARDQSTE